MPKDIMKIIESTEVNTRYDAYVEDIMIIYKNSRDINMFFYNAFVYGYAQGAKAVRAANKKKKYQGTR